MVTDLGLSSALGVSPLALIILLAWSLIWKGVALWKSARKNSIVWFIILLVVNTAGILEILYIFIFSKIGKAEKTKKAKRSRKRKK